MLYSSNLVQCDLTILSRLKLHLVTQVGTLFQDMVCGIKHLVVYWNFNELDTDLDATAKM